MSSAAVGAIVGAVAALAASPHLARLTVTVPDREVRRWWIGAPPSRGALRACALVAVVLGALAGAAAHWSALLPAFLLLALIGTPLVVIDIRVHRLPNRLIVPAYVLGAALLTLAAAEEDAWSRLLRAAEGAAAVYAVLFLLAVAAPRGFGMGDVKLGGIVGGYLGWFGWGAVYYGVFAGFLIGAVLAVALLASRSATMKTAIPFGPMLFLGPLIVLAFDLVP